MADHHCHECGQILTEYRYLYPYPGCHNFEGVRVCLECYPEAVRRQEAAGLVVGVGGGYANSENPHKRKENRNGYLHTGDGNTVP